MLEWVAKRLKHVCSNTDQTIETGRWASVVGMPASNMFDTLLSKRTKHRPSNTRTKEMLYVFDRMFGPLGPGQTRNVCNQTPSDIVWWTNILPCGHLVWCCLSDLNRVWSCLMSDLLFVWTAAYQTCLKRACVPRLLGSLYQLFDLCLIKHVLTVWPLTSTIASLVTEQCLMVFGRQKFLVCPDP